MFSSKIKRACATSLTTPQTCLWAESSGSRKLWNLADLIRNKNREMQTRSSMRRCASSRERKRLKQSKLARKKMLKLKNSGILSRMHTQTQMTMMSQRDHKLASILRELRKIKQKAWQTSSTRLQRIAAERNSERLISPLA